MAASFFLIWTTAPDSFRPRHMRGIESICRWHPGMRIDMFSNTLPADFFVPLEQCDVHVARYDLAALTRGTRTGLVRFSPVLESLSFLS
jgi:predicted HD phosphohydrolase